MGVVGRLSGTCQLTRRRGDAEDEGTRSLEGLAVVGIVPLDECDWKPGCRFPEMLRLYNSGCKISKERYAELIGSAKGVEALTSLSVERSSKLPFLAPFRERCPNIESLFVEGPRIRDLDEIALFQKLTNLTLNVVKRKTHLRELIGPPLERLSLRSDDPTEYPLLDQFPRLKGLLLRYCRLERCDLELSSVRSVEIYATDFRELVCRGQPRHLGLYSSRHLERVNASSVRRCIVETCDNLDFWKFESASGVIALSISPKAHIESIDWLQRFEALEHLGIMRVRATLGQLQVLKSLKHLKSCWLSQGCRVADLRAISESLPDVVFTNGNRCFRAGDKSTFDDLSDVTRDIYVRRDI